MTPTTITVTRQLKQIVKSLGRVEIRPVKRADPDEVEILFYHLVNPRVEAVSFQGILTMKGRTQANLFAPHDLGSTATRVFQSAIKVLSPGTQFFLEFQKEYQGLCLGSDQYRTTLKLWWSRRGDTYQDYFLLDADTILDT